MSGLQVLLVGIDAGCLSVLDRLSADGRVPNVDEIRETGVSASLESQVPPWTPSAWPSLYTGVNPGKHGVFGFTGYDGYDYHVVDRDDVRARAIWEVLDEHDRSSVVVNVPVTDPVDEIDGAIVPGFIGPENPTCHPDGVLTDVRDAIGEYRVYPEYTRGQSGLSDEEKINEYCALARMRGAAFRYLCDRFDPAFGFVQFQKTDTVFHEFDGEWDLVERIYAATDEQIGRLVDACEPDVTMLVSDHGIGRYEGEQVHVNTLLETAGYLETTRGGRGMPSWQPIRNRLREGDEAKQRQLTPTERAAAGLARAGITARRVGRVLESLRVDGIVKRYLPDGVTRTAAEQVDFAESQAFMRARVELGVRLNVAGREPDGTVDPEEYEAVRREVISTLRDAETPSGDPAFGRVLPREDVFHGPHVEAAPDVVVEPNEYNHFLSAEPGDDPFRPNRTPWNHKLPGLFVAAGNVDTEAPVTDPHLLDVAPTVLAAMDVPYDERMDGRVLAVTDDPGTRDYGDYTTGDDRADTAAVEKRLADLGYVE
jgi:predicted AlkP superfamily phosphohydrolase/phosphomutase